MKATACAALAAFSMVAPWAHAGRPLGTDDASTAAPRSCQLEAWFARSGPDTSAVLAPACGLAEGLELDLGLGWPAQRRSQPLTGNLAVKVAPTSWAHETSAGTVAWGLKAGADFEQATGTGWRHADSTGLLLLTWQPSNAWALHVNLGRGLWHPAGQAGLQATLYNLAASWSPTEQALLFAEWQGNNRRGDLGPALRSAGGRWWLQKDKLGLDLTVGRAASAGAPTQLTLGFGWYGLPY